LHKHRELTVWFGFHLCLQQFELPELGVTPLTDFGFVDFSEDLLRDASRLLPHEQ
jgi:hypothetical protein